MRAIRGNFVRIRRQDWRLAGHTSADQRDRLLAATTFEAIVAIIAREARVTACGCEPKDDEPTYHRAVVTLELPSTLVDVFHSGCAGIRAQYYRSPDFGDRAKRYAIARLMSVIERALRTSEDWPWIKESLTHHDAKVWVHEGTWFRQRQKGERRLRVARWIKARPSGSRRERRKRRWAMLTPTTETRLEVKGAFLDDQSVWFGRSSKPRRAREIHENGYT